MYADLAGGLFDAATRARLDELVELRGEVLTDFTRPEANDTLREVEVLVTGWGAPEVDAAALAAAPELRAIVHTAGTVKGIVDPACWERGVTVSTAASANAVPVAEFTLAMIILAGKDAFATEHRDRYLRPHDNPESTGNYRRTVGIVGASRVGRRLLELLRKLDLDVLLSDPFVSPEEARALGATWHDLDEVISLSRTLSLHAPSVPETRHLIDKRRLGLMPDGATLINTSRGALVDEAALVDELTTGRINAILDVTDPEPPAADSPLYTLPNVFITPHIAGSIGNEVQRLGAAAVDELARYVAGQPFEHEVSAAHLPTMA
ncbi:hydroxyacid dehydrogenase [Jiangella asiatica]|uniref:Hydroxyacid dehydrogenase n=2 Tax=Jiangella asiatica TaxID=2530372 RepID=A0A4R5D7F2_9ACTN|nr:hydroxyacid dehydrogenase [Jiangella asiatica]